MGRKCAVPHCYTGYRKCKEKASLYRVPDDDFFLSKWQEAIARDDRPITPKDYVCEKHFKDDDILRRRIIKDVVEEYQRPRLKPDAIPTIFPDLPEFILKMVKKRRKMPTDDVNAPESCDSSKSDENTGNNITEQSLLQEIKSESPEINKTNNIASTMGETTLSNELDIKSEPEECTDHAMENDGEIDTNDCIFGIKMFGCTECDYQTKYPHNLRTHKTKHLTGEEAYLHCEQCPNFRTKWELTYRNHLKIKHGIGKQEVFKCGLCTFETKVKLCLKRHYERHQRDEGTKTSDFTENDKSKNFKCTECFYETNSKTHIIRHIKTTHNAGDDTIVSINKVKPTTAGEIIYDCVKRSYKMKSQSNLLKHVLERKYPKSTDNQFKSSMWKCPKCPFATFFQQALLKHLETNCKSDFITHSLTHRSIGVESVNPEELFGVNMTGPENRVDEIERQVKRGEVNKEPEFVTVKNEISDLK